jgi:predicted homoserine dehydrogenase-like protein
LSNVTEKSTAPASLVVIGAELIGEAHIQRILEIPGAELVGIVDVAPKVPETLSHPLGEPRSAGRGSRRHGRIHED